ncbi:MAG: ATP-binding protein [Halobacteriales archaeon]
MSKAAREQFGDLPDYRRDNEQGSLAAMIWRVFERGESLYVPDTRELESLTEEPRSRCVLVYPVGDHGVFIASNERPDSFDNTDRSLFEVLASTLTSALDRVEREQRLRRQKSRMQQHRQRLTVLNRVLRHDIRSKINLIFGEVSKLRRAVDDAPALGAIENQSRKILELSENARHIEKTIEDGDETTTTVDITDVIIQNVESLKQAFSNPRIRTDMPEEIYVISNGLIDPAVENVLTNAIEHNDSTPPEVEVTVTPDNGDVVVRVADNGPGMPQQEREVFKRKEETQLKHSSGIGLWLVHWIIEDVDGAIEIEDGYPRGTVVELRVPQPTTPEVQRQV